MSLIEFLVLLLVAAIIGAIGEALAGYSPGGCAVSIVVGFVGAIIGRWLPQVLGLPLFLTVDVSGVHFPIIWSILGGALFVLVLRAIRGRPARVE